MKRKAFAAAVLLSASVGLAQTLPELFGQLKEQVKTAAWADASKTLDALDAESSKPGNEAVRKQLEGPLAFYRGVCDANLDNADAAVERFGAFQKLQPGATIDPAVYSKKAVAAFEKAQKAAAARAPSLAEAYREFQPPADAAERDRADQYWGEGPVRWIMTPQEKTQWAALTDPNARVDFVEKFWTARASVSGADGRTYRQEFERRAAFADANLAEDEEQRGSLTDRGMVFLLMGPPTYAGRKPLRTGEDTSDDAGMSTVGSQDAKNAEKGMWASGKKPSSGQLAVKSVQFGGPGKKAIDSSDNRMEVWHYRRELLPKGALYQQVDFQFVTKKGYGANVLQRESDTVNTLEAARGKVRPPA